MKGAVYIKFHYTGIYFMAGLTKSISDINVSIVVTFQASHALQQFK